MAAMNLQIFSFTGGCNRTWRYECKIREKQKETAWFSRVTMCSVMVQQVIALNEDTKKQDILQYIVACRPVAM
jgi:hypothetical protein